MERLWKAFHNRPDDRQTPITRVRLILELGRLNGSAKPVRLAPRGGGVRALEVGAGAVSSDKRFTVLRDTLGQFLFHAARSTCCCASPAGRAL